MDDLAANPRNDDQPVPLEHLSDIAKRNTSAEVNNTLAELFHPESTRTLTVLDPRFHPGMNAVTIQVVPAKNPEDPSTYDLVQSDGARASDSTGARSTAEEAAPNSPWENQGMTDKDWLKLLKSLEKRKARLDPPPPENHRERESYLTLRNLLLSDASARKAFLSVHWKGKPSGLPLLCQLLSQGTWIPDAETDSDYLEAELNHLDREHAARASSEGAWTIGQGWMVTREIRTGAIRTYSASPPSAD